MGSVGAAAVEWRAGAEDEDAKTEQRGPGKGQGERRDGRLLQNCPSRTGREGDKPQTQFCIFVPTPTQLPGVLVPSQTQLWAEPGLQQGGLFWGLELVSF